MYLTMQAGYGIVAISVSGYFRSTEYSGYKVSISTEVLFGTFLRCGKIPHSYFGFHLQARLK